MCIEGTANRYWRLESWQSQYLYPDIYDTHVLYYIKYESCSSRPSPASDGSTATGGHIEYTIKGIKRRRKKYKIVKQKK